MADGLREPMRQVAAGRVRVYRPEMGFGFITPDDDSYDVYVQAADVDEPSGAALVAGEPVEYQPAIGPDGQLHAVAVHTLHP